MPSYELYKQYLAELEEKTETSMLDSERKAILARKEWTDLVSEKDRVNAIYLEKNKLKQRTIQFLQNKYGVQGDKNYHDLVEYLKNNTAIVIFFKAAFLAERGLEHYKILNRYHAKPEKNETEGRKGIENLLLRDSSSLHYLRLNKLFKFPIRYSGQFRIFPSSFKFCGDILICISG
jgi:hypothetical protein